MTAGNQSLPLDENETSRLYWELHRRGAFCSGEKKAWRRRAVSLQDLVVLSLLQCRYDPRLTAILTEWLPRIALRLDPVLLKSDLKEKDALPVAAVIGDFALSSGGDLPYPVREFFSFLQTGVKPVPIQLFYRGLYPVAGRKMDEAISQPLWYFKKWGFLAADIPILKEKLSGKRVYHYDQEIRLRQLHLLSRERKTFRLREYLAAVDFSVSRQQALKDLQSLPTIRKKGRGKGAFYTTETSPGISWPRRFS